MTRYLPMPLSRILLQVLTAGVGPLPRWRSPELAAGYRGIAGKSPTIGFKRLSLPIGRAGSPARGRELTAAAARHGWNVVGPFEGAGISGDLARLLRRVVLARQPALRTRLDHQRAFAAARVTNLTHGGGRNFKSSIEPLKNKISKERAAPGQPEPPGSTNGRK
jgi:hypothetical protein